MKKICGAIALGSLCSLFAMGATQDPEKKLTKAAIEDAARDLKGVRIGLWDHAGVMSEGSAMWITGDGAVETAWNEYYPLTREERYSLRKLRLALPADDVRKIVRLFAVDDVLALPKVRTDLLGVRETRFTIGMSVAGVGAFDGEHPNLEWSKLPKVPAAGTLIKTLRSSVQDLQARIAKQDEEFLTKERLSKLIDVGEAKLVLELRDIQGLWGGKSVRIHSDGIVEGVTVGVPRQGQSGMQVQHFKGSVPKDRAVAILKECVESGTLELQPPQRFGVPDEAFPRLVIRATVDGATYARSVGMWEGQVVQHPAFGEVRKALLDLPGEPVKKTSK
jgi:hypothetical protein